MKRNKAIRKLIPNFLFCLLLVRPCVAVQEEQRFIIDLSGTRSWDEISASGAPFKELKGFPLSKVYRVENILAAWNFPGGTTFQHHMSQGSVSFRDGQLTMSSYGEMMPLDEVLVVARQLHALLKEPLEPLAKWESEARAKGFEAKNYTFGARNCNPSIDCEIRHSFGVVYPWIIVLRAAWLTEKEMKKPLPLPFTGAGLINLDPPSGKRYTPEEEHQKYKELYTPKPVSEKGKAPHPPPPVTASAPAPESESDSRSFLWLWGSLGILALAIVLFVLRRLKSKRRTANR
jgi:hypothetical protein